MTSGCPATSWRELLRILVLLSPSTPSLLKETGMHETSSADSFSAGVANRGSSVRIPREVAAKGYGYLEDRRPASNADPYSVTGLIVKSCCLSESSWTSEKK